jgi:hypothetical protein
MADDTGSTAQSEAQRMVDAFASVGVNAGALIVLLRAAGEQEENGPSSVSRATGPRS